GTGRTTALFLLQGLWIALLIPALIIGAHANGIVGVALGHVIVATGFMFPIFTIVVAQRGPSVRTVLRQLVRPVAAAAVGWLVAITIVHHSSSNILAILLGGSALVLLYALLAAKPAELWTLPKRFMRFEPADGAPATVPA